VVFAQAPDLSKTNEQDGGSAMADQQAENQGDRNVKVIARGGTVTLKGPVPSDEEKTAIESKAVEIAGAVNVKNEFTVKSKTEK
jgi:hyperosmotically inducible periplasmic protein